MCNLEKVKPLKGLFVKYSTFFSSSAGNKTFPFNFSFSNE